MATRSIGDLNKTNGHTSLEDPMASVASHADLSRAGKPADTNELNELGQKIFLDRYAMKDMHKRTLGVGDMVIVCVDDKTGQREVATVRAMDGPRVSVELRDGAVVERLIEHVAKPIETDPEQMMERVARGIAAVEGEQADEWYHKFRWLLQGWKFVPAGRILTAAGTDQQLTFYNCMPPDQEILTSDGYKPIAEVKVGDLVVTHRNRLRRVLNRFERETEEPIYVIKARKLGYDDLRVTGEHKILVIRSEWVNSHKGRDGLKLQREAEWIPARELKPGDYIAAAYDGEHEDPRPIYISEHLSGYQVSDGKIFKPQQRGDYHGYLNEGGTKHSINDRLILDRDLCYLFGRWLGDGCVTHQTETDIPSGIKIVFALDEREEAESVARIIEEKFGVPASLKMSSTERWLDLWVNSMPVGQFFKALFGCYSYGKRIPSLLSRLPDELALALLKGLFAADGYTSGNKLGILLSNRRLATQVHQMLMRLGYFFSIKENTHRLGRRPAYRIQATANEGGDLFKDFFGKQAPPHEIDLKYYFEHDGLRWSRITEIALEDYSGVVLDIEVDEDHSFVSAGMVVSNCYVVPSPKDSRRGIVDTLSQMMEIMSRGGGVGINVSSLRPRHSYVKGVNGRSSGAVSWGALYSFVTGLIEQGGSRRGALMIILNCWHPDVTEFINAKRDMGKITNANISVGITDKFMKAVEADADWDLVFADTSDPDYETMWDGNLDKWLAAGKKVITHRTVKARKLWDSIIESAWASAEPGVFFIERYNKMSNSWYYDSGYIGCTNPCGEQGLPGWGVCNLGAINLSKFVRDSEVDWEGLGKSVRYAVRFLDNVIDATPYFFDENYDQQKSERRVGLNTMGLAEMLIRLGIRYGSDESVQFIDRLYHFIASEAYHSSADIAAEKGSFPLFEAEKFLESGYMQSMPEEVRRVVSEKGMRNVTLLTQAPNGCITPDTLVFKDGGLRPIGSLGDPDGEQWQDVSFKTHSDTGAKSVNKYYVNGFKEVVEVITARGFNLAATLQHSVRVIDSEGCYVWRQMGEVQPGDVLVMARGGLGQSEIPLLDTVSTRHRRSKLLLPETMTPDLAELLGFYIGDGYLKDRRGLGVAVDARDRDVVGRLQDLISRVFNLDAKVDDTGRNCLLVWAPSYFIPRWLRTNGLAKTGASDAFIPEAVLAGGAATMSAFLRGLFESDGSISNGVVTFVSSSQRLAKEVQIALLGLGIVSTRRSIEPGEGRYGSGIRHEVRLLNSSEVLRFRESVGFASRRKQTLLESCEYRGSRADSIPAALLRRLYIESEGLPTGVRQELAGALKSGMTQEKWRGLKSATPALGDLPSASLLDGHLFFDVAATINLSQSLTFDLSVPDTNTYVANGLVAHNTIGTMVGTSTGIEPFYFWSYYRKSRLGKHEERVGVLEEWQRTHPGEPVPDYFVTAMDLAPEEHVKVQASIQRWVDSSISKTCNLPANYTVEQTRKIYEMLYRLGCKGGTIYRDGSRDVQVLNLKEEDKKTSAPKEEKVERVVETTALAEASPVSDMVESSGSLQPKVRPRPYKRRGYTVSKATPSGTAHITMNEDEENQPFEVFVEIGKAGSDIKAMAEAMGRLMSLILRMASPVSPVERVREIVKQITGIGGARSYGFGKRRVLSLPDAVGQALAENYLGASYNEDPGQGAEMGVDPPAVAPAKKKAQALEATSADLCPNCGDAAFVRVEGCQTCYACGYSEC